MEPIDPSTALQLYLSARSTELTGSTQKAHNYRLGHFVRWCEQESIDNMNDLSGRDLHRYKMWRQEEGDLNKVTLKTQMDTLRVFIGWCESVDAVLPDLHEKVLSPTLNRSEGQREIMLEEEAAEDILRYLNKFHYASFPHVLLLLLWHTGIRSGTARAIDVRDGGTGLRPARVQVLRTDLMKVTGIWLPHRRSEIEGYTERFRGQITRRLREAVAEEKE